MTCVRTTQRKTRPGSGIASRYRALLLTHSSLEEKLADELKRPMPDSAIVQRIKRRKLAIKDELASIDRLLDAIGAEKGREDASPSLDHAGWPVVSGRSDPDLHEGAALAHTSTSPAQGASASR